MQSKSKTTNFVNYDNPNDVVESLFSRYQSDLETSMRERESDFFPIQFNCCIKIVAIYILNLKTEDEKCFQYPVTVALSYGETESSPGRVLSIKPFMNKYNWDEIKYPSNIDDLKTFGKNNSTIVLNIL